jgi:hypothetical protein
MTDRLIHALSRQPVTRLVRPLAAFLLSLALAYGGGLWLTTVHHVEGGTEAGQPGFVAHWLRDATLALPVVMLAVWVGLLITRRVLSRSAAEPSLAVGAALLAMVVGGLTAAGTSVFGPLHRVLFAAEHGGHETAWWSHLLRDAFIAFPVNLILAGAIAAALARSRPWDEPQVLAWGVPGRGIGRFAWQGGLAVMLLAPVVLFAQVGTERAIAGSGPGTPCPAGAPVKSFDINAINVDIPLNRFGDHDSLGKMYALRHMIPAIRAQETSRHVSAGLRDDPIQPLVVRANMGDCVEINFANEATGEYGVHVDGLAFDAGSSGDAVGRNEASSVSNGGTRAYRYYVPKDAELEGAHYIRPGAGNRDAVSHGLFGVLVVEPEGSRYLHPDTGADIPFGWGWEATILPPNKKAFREANLLHHEIGDEKYIIPSTSLDAPGSLPVKDPTTTSYRPGSRALNYRSEPFMHRLKADALDRLKAYAYNSYTFGDPATPMPRGYLGDPTKIRLVHAGAELFHVYHLHGGGDRWRVNPHADSSYDYQDTGLNKTPVEKSASQRLDSQSIGPGESYNLEIEGGAGGVQQSAGDFLFHCHIAEHYVSGMWSVWRVYDTKQPDFATLPDRNPLPDPVDSSGLIGKTINGQTITAGNLHQWIEPQLPPQGVPQKAAGDPISLDGAVWNWLRQGDVYYGEPEDKTGSLAGSPWAGVRFPNLSAPGNFPNGDGGARVFPGHPGLMAVDVPHSLGPNDRPRVLFNPTNGRPTYPMLRPHIGQRPPYSPNGHTGSPWLGEEQNKAPVGAIDPWANRPDGLCPQGSDPTKRDFNIVSIHKKLQVTKRGATDDFGKLFVLAKNKDKVRNGTMPAEPLAIRANVGECVNLTVTSEQTADDPNQPFPMTNLHIHHVQFDPNGSDGATAGMVYGQAMRPYRIEDAQVSNAIGPGATTVDLKTPSAVEFPDNIRDLSKFRNGVWIGVGLGTENLEVRQILSGGGTSTVTLDRPLEKAHGADEWIGTEFVRETWFPDVVLDNIFWHDHVDGIHNWGHGLVGQLVIEPRGSTYHDPQTGEQVDSGALVDIHTGNPLAPGLVNGSFREFVLWSIDQNPTTDSTLNLKAEPLSDRRAVDPDPSLLYSSYRHGDPYTRIPRAYAGDPFVIRTINVSPGVDTLHIDGHKAYTENRFTDSAGKVAASPVSSILYGISERYTLAFNGGAGGPGKVAGDYLYTNGIGRRTEHGAWGLIRVLPERRVADLQPLPGHDIPFGQTDPPQTTGGRPPAAATTGEPCDAGATQKTFQISAVNVPGGVIGRTLAYVPTADAAAVKAGLKVPEPLVLHVAAGDCVNVEFTNQLVSGRASFHVDKLRRDTRSSGINAGFNPEQTVAPGGAKNYRVFADDAKLGSALISDYGGDDTGVKGLYGALIVSPAGATFADPVTGGPKDIGTQVDVNVPGQMGYRDFSLIFSDNEPTIGINTMPYPPGVATPTQLNYGSANGRALDAAQFSSIANGDPATSILQAYAGDGMQVHVLGAPGSEQQHVFNLGGHTWAWDQHIAKSEQLANQGFGPLTSLDLKVRGGAGSPGDYFYGDIRRPFTDVGMWGLLRVFTPGQSGPIQALKFNPLPSSPGGQKKDRTPISKLVIGKQFSKTQLGKSGLAFRVTGPTDTRVLRVKLFRVTSSRKTLVTTTNIEVISNTAFSKLSKNQKSARSRLVVAANGRIRAIWKPSPKVLKAVKASRYQIEVQGGLSTTAIDPTVLRANLRITAPPVAKKPAQ